MTSQEQAQSPMEATVYIMHTNPIACAEWLSWCAGNIYTGKMVTK